MSARLPLIAEGSRPLRWRSAFEHRWCRRGRFVALGGAMLPGYPAGQPLADPQHPLEVTNGRPPAAVRHGRRMLRCCSTEPDTSRIDKWFGHFQAFWRRTRRCVPNNLRRFELSHARSNAVCLMKRFNSCESRCAKG
jgi:hypothetical protein